MLKGWRSFQGAAVPESRGVDFTSFPISVDPLSENAKSLAQATCQGACEQTKGCCMECTKPIWKSAKVGWPKGYVCTLYKEFRGFGKFGGKSDEEIESLSTWNTNEDCAFKDKYLSCMAT